MLLYLFWAFGLFRDIWYILWQFGIFSGNLVHFVDIWYILWTFGTFCGHLVHFVVFFSRFGMLHREKSGNPGAKSCLAHMSTQGKKFLPLQFPLFISEWSHKQCTMQLNAPIFIIHVAKTFSPQPT
jgi:hypothetical protein